MSQTISEFEDNEDIESTLDPVVEQAICFVEENELSDWDVGQAIDKASQTMIARAKRRRLMPGYEPPKPMAKPMDKPRLGQIEMSLS